MALKKGEIDMMGYNGISPLSIKDFADDKNVEIIVSPGIELVWMTFNMHKPMMQDLRVRQAITYGIDRQQLIDLAYLGYAKPQYGFIYPDLAEFNPDLPHYGYDPEKAKGLLTEAGYVDTDGDGLRNDSATGDNLSLGFVVSSESSDSVKCARLIIEQLGQLGVDVSLKAVDSNTYYEFYYVPTEDQWDLGHGARRTRSEPLVDLGIHAQLCRRGRGLECGLLQQPRIRQDPEHLPCHHRYGQTQRIGQADAADHVRRPALCRAFATGYDQPRTHRQTRGLHPHHGRGFHLAQRVDLFQYPAQKIAHAGRAPIVWAEPDNPRRCMFRKC